MKDESPLPVSATTASGLAVLVHSAILGVPAKGTLELTGGTNGSKLAGKAGSGLGLATLRGEGLVVCAHDGVAKSRKIKKGILVLGTASCLQVECRYPRRRNR